MRQGATITYIFKNAFLDAVNGPRRVILLQGHMRKETLLYLGVLEERCAIGVARWPHTWKMLGPTNKRVCMYCHP